MKPRTSVLASVAATMHLDDHFAELSLPFSFRFQGCVYTSAFINSNGSLTFGVANVDVWPTVPLFLNGPPRIAANWTAMSPGRGGTVTVREAPGTWTVAFDKVPETGSDTSTFSVTLCANGRIEISYGANAGSVNRLPRLVGVTPGGGAADPGETDLSAAEALSAIGTTYEAFVGYEAIGGITFDLDFRVLRFEP